MEAAGYATSGAACVTEVRATKCAFTLMGKSVCVESLTPSVRCPPRTPTAHFLPGYISQRTCFFLGARGLQRRLCLAPVLLPSRSRLWFAAVAEHFREQTLTLVFVGRES